MLSRVGRLASCSSGRLVVVHGNLDTNCRTKWNHSLERMMTVCSVAAEPSSMSLESWELKGTTMDPSSMNLGPIEYTKVNPSCTLALELASVCIVCVCVRGIDI